MKKILNPLNSRRFTNDELLGLPIHNINGIDFRVIIVDERHKVYSCQCFKDCNCYGSTRGEAFTYYRRVEHDNTNKAFYSDPNYVPVSNRETEEAK